MDCDERGSITLKQDVETNNETAPRARPSERAPRAVGKRNVVLAFAFPTAPPRDPCRHKQDGCVARRRETNQPSKRNQKGGGSPGGERVGWCEETRAPPNPARVPSQAEIKQALVNGGLCRGRTGGGWLVTRIGSWRDGHHGHAAGRRAVRSSPRQRARGRTETSPPKGNLRRPNSRLGPIRQRARDLHRFQRRLVVWCLFTVRGVLRVTVM